MTQPEFDDLIARTCQVTVTDPNTPLADLGIDSLAHLNLLVAVEQRYAIEIDPDELLDPALATPAGLREYAEAHAAA
jgi:acyl carrier protein